MKNFINQIADTLRIDNEIKFKNKQLKITMDHGTQSIQAFYEVRRLDVLFQNKEYKIGLHFFQRHNGPCLAVAMFDQENKFGNAIQFVFNKEKVDENENVTFYHNGIVGGGVPGLTSKIMRDYLVSEKSNLTIVDGKKILLGEVSIHKKLDWENENYIAFIINIIEYAIHRRRLKDKYYAYTSTSEKELISNKTTSIDNKIASVREGSVIYKLHKKRERNPTIVRKKKEQVFNEFGKLECEVCGFDFEAIYGDLGKGFIECHHITPLSEHDEETETTIDDLAIVCPNCHRMLHKGIHTMSINNLKEIRNSVRNKTN